MRMTVLSLLTLAGYWLVVIAANALAVSPEPTAPWNLPVTPAVIPDFPDVWANVKGKKIPRHLWMAFKDVPKREDMKDYLSRMISRNENQGWVMHLADNAEKLDFMRKYYSGTSVLWAYEIIHPQLGNSAADIWRYAVLWMIGGLYMDDDSYFEASFDNVIGVNDTLIVAAEKNPYHDDCYITPYRLSAHSMHQRFNRTVGHLFGGRTLVSWAVFAQPKHPIMFRMLENIVDVVRQEYIRKPVTNMRKWDVKWKLCMCATGPPLLTASAREVLLEHMHAAASSNESGTTEGTASKVQYTLHKRDYINFGGVFKMPDNHQDGEKHYMHTMEKYNIPLLASYKELDKTDLEGRVITSDGKELFLVLNGVRRGFTDYDAFTAFHFHLKDVIKLTDEKFAWFPPNEKMLTVEDGVAFLSKGQQS